MIPNSRTEMLSIPSVPSVLLLLVLFLYQGYSQNEIGSDSLDKKTMDIPQLTQVEINGEFIDYKKLSDLNYRRSIEFGNTLYNSFDSVYSQNNYPINLRLPYNLNDLTFHFSTIDWGAPHRIKYSYLLEGYDSEWSNPDSQSKVVFQELPPGQYSIKIKAIGADQIWSEPTTYSFEIRRPWWLTWWAYGLYAISFLLICYWAYHSWQEKKSQEAEIRKLLEAYKLTDLPKAIEMKKGIEESSFLKLVQTTLETHLSDENFGIAELCELLNISRAQLHRKLKKLTGLSTSHYIRSLRLEIAKELLVTTNLNISEVAFKVGFSSATYFSKVFKSQYGHAPSDHQ